MSKRSYYVMQFIFYAACIGLGIYLCPLHHWVMKALGFTAIVGSLFGIWIDIHRLHNDKKHHTPLNFQIFPVILYMKDLEVYIEVVVYRVYGLKDGVWHLDVQKEDECCTNWALYRSDSAPVKGQKIAIDKLTVSKSFYAHLFGYDW